MNYITMAIFGLGAFVAIWLILVIPAENRHHARKMELVRKKLQRHAEQSAVVDDESDDSD